MKQAWKKHKEDSQRSNNWKDQDDAFFGESDGVPTSSRAKATSSATSNKRNDNGTINQPNKSTWNSTTTKSRQKEKIAAFAGSISSKLSQTIKNAKTTGESIRNIGKRDIEPTTASNSKSKWPSSRSTYPGQRRPTNGTSNGHDSNTNNSDLTSRSTASTRTAINAPSDRHTTDSSTETIRTTDVSTTKRGVKHHLKSGLLSQVPLPCKYCGSIPFMMFKSHPYFDSSERICISHDESLVKRCTGCDRFLSKNHPMEPGRGPLCKECQKTAIWTQGEVERLYLQVLKLLSEVYGFSLYKDRMQSIPIKLVDDAKLNGMNSFSPHSGDTFNSKKRGLCLYMEVGSLIPITTITNAFQRFNVGNNTKSKDELQNKKLQRSRDPNSRGSLNVMVQNITVLHGLPTALTGSILAHEATHAWFALNPLRKERLPIQVEEGCCQLVAFLYLNHILYNRTQSYGGGSFNRETDKYFRWAIENDQSEVYGEGYRKAAKAYQSECSQGRGLLTLLEYVCQHRAFPNVS